MLSKAENVIGQFNHEEIKRILPTIRQQAATKKDFVLRAPSLAVDDSGRLALAGVESFRLANSGDTFATFPEADAAAGTGATAEKIIHQKENGTFPLRRTAERQLLTRIGVGVDFADKLRREGQADLAAHVINERLRRPREGVDNVKSCRGEKKPLPSTNQDRFLVRMLNGNVRAVLSDSYRVIDNIDLFYAAAEKMEDPKVGAEIWQMRLTDDSFQMLAVSRGISGQVRLDRPYDPGDGWLSRWKAEGDGTDTQYAALSISNSETGGGSVSIAPAVMTRVCANFQVWAKTLRAVHLGKRRLEEGLIESADIQAAESRLVWMKVRAAIEKVFDPEAFRAYIDGLNDSTQRLIVKDVNDATAIQKAVEVVAERYDIKPETANDIFANLMKSRDFTQYGTIQAITETAHRFDSDGSVDTSRDLEIIGGDLAHVSGTEWRDLVRA